MYGESTVGGLTSAVVLARTDMFVIVRDMGAQVVDYRHGAHPLGRESSHLSTSSGSYLT